MINEVKLLRVLVGGRSPQTRSATLPAGAGVIRQVSETGLHARPGSAVKNSGSFGTDEEPNAET